LVAHVLFPAERAAVGDQLDRDPRVIDAQHAGDVVAVVPHALTPRIHVKGSCSTGASGHGDGALGLQEGVFDSLGLERLGHHVGRSGEGGVDVTAGITADAEHVVVGPPHGDLGGFDGSSRVGDRSMHDVLDANEFGGGSGGLTTVGHHDCQNVDRRSWFVRPPGS